MNNNDFFKKIVEPNVNKEVAIALKGSCSRHRRWAQGFPDEVSRSPATSVGRTQSTWRL
jgi:hypothetical protein